MQWVQNVFDEKNIKISIKSEVDENEYDGLNLKFDLVKAKIGTHKVCFQIDYVDETGQDEYLAYIEEKGKAVEESKEKLSKEEQFISFFKKYVQIEKKEEIEKHYKETSRTDHLGNNSNIWSALNQLTAIVEKIHFNSRAGCQL